MVIIVNEDDSNNPQSPSSKTDSTFVPSTPITQSSSQQPLPPPSYQVSQQAITPAPSSSGVTDHHQPLLPKQPDPFLEDRASSRRAFKRFCKAFAVALLIYFLMAGLISSLTPNRHRNKKPERGRSDDDSADPDNGGWDTSKPPEWPGHGTWSPQKDCSPIWSVSSSPTPPTNSQDQQQRTYPDLPPIYDAPYHQTISFELDPSAPSHLLVAAHTWGDITFAVQAGSGNNIIGVDVTAHYHTKEALSRAKVCKIKKDDGSEGVGIWVPNLEGHRRKEDRVSFSLAVTFPVDFNTPRLQIRSFETDLPLFMHHLHGLSQLVSFDNLKLFSSNMYIRGDDVFAKNLDVQTSNAQIEGFWKGDDLVKLVTTNAPINVQVSLAERNDGGTTHATLKTSNAPLTAQFFIGDTPFIGGTGGRFSVDTQTTNAPSSLTFLDSPYRAYLALSSSTTNSHASVRLHYLFEGRYHLQTAPVVGSTILNWATKGQERDRMPRKNQMVRSSTKSTIDGNVSWGDWKDERDYYGSVDVRTTVGNVELTI